MNNLKSLQKVFLSLLLLALAYVAYKAADSKRTVYASLPTQGSIMLSGKAADSIFKSVIARYSLGDSVIKKIKSPLKKSDSLFASYRLTLPRDIPVPLLVAHLKAGFPAGSVEIVAGEKDVNGTGWLELYSGNEMKLYTEVRPDKKWERKNGSVLFLVSGIEEADAEALESILSSSELFAVVVKPAYDSEIITSLLKQHRSVVPEAANGKEHIDFLFLPQYNAARMREALRAYKEKFPTLSHILIRPETEIFKSTGYAALKALLFSAGCDIIPGNEIYSLKGLSLQAAEKKMTEWLKLTSPKGFLAVEISADRFNETAVLRENLRRKGVRFLNINKTLFN